jgi:hypothetical protein
VDIGSRTRTPHAQVLATLRTCRRTPERDAGAGHVVRSETRDRSGAHRLARRQVPLGGQPFTNVLTAEVRIRGIGRTRSNDLSAAVVRLTRGRLKVHPGHRSSRSECTETGPAARRPVSRWDGREQPSTVQPGVVSNVPVSVCDFVGRMGECATTL